MGRKRIRLQGSEDHLGRKRIRLQGSEDHLGRKRIKIQGFFHGLRKSKRDCFGTERIKGSLLWYRESQLG